MKIARGINGRTIQIAWLPKRILVEVIEHRQWGGTRAVPDSYVVSFVHRSDREKYGSPYHETYPCRPYDLSPVGKYTLDKLNKLELASHEDYQNEWVSYYM